MIVGTRPKETGPRETGPEETGPTDSGPADAAARWFDSVDAGHGVTLFTEPHVHDFARCNIWLVAGRDADLLIDSGSGLVPLMPFVVALRGVRPTIVAGTHIHFDHVGGHHEFVDRRAHPAEAPGYAVMECTPGERATHLRIGRSGRKPS